MPVIEVAAGIPCPQTSTVTPEERRLLSEGAYGPRGARTIELDERQFQTLTWALSAVQAAAFRDWYRVTLIYGGAWFAAPATWPTPEGLVVKVRRFIGDPQWTYRGNGHWLLSLNAEVRGETLLPNEPMPTDGPLWLDTFTGSAGVALSSHAQDVPLSGSVWEAIDSFETVEPLLNGTGEASGAYSLDGFQTKAGTYFGGSEGTGVELSFPYTLNIEFTPLQQIPHGEASGYDSTFMLRGFSPDTDIDFGIYCGVAPTGQPYLNVYGYGGSVATFYEGVIEDGPNTLSVLYESDGVTVTINGVAQTKIAVAVSSNVYMFRLVLGSSQEGIERVSPFATSTRAELTGTLA